MSRTPARAAVRRRRRAGESHHFSFRVTLHTFLFTQYTREPNQGAEAELIQWPRQAATLVIDRCSPVSTDRHPDRACTRSRRGRATRRPRARKPARLQDAWAHRRLGTGGARRMLAAGRGAQGGRESAAGSETRGAAAHLPRRAPREAAQAYYSSCGTDCPLGGPSTDRWRWRSHARGALGCEDCTCHDAWVRELAVSSHARTWRGRACAALSTVRGR